MNKDERNAKVAFQPLKINKNFKMGLPKEEIFFKRFVAATEKGLHEHLSKELGEDYGQALVDGDPEIDFNSIGKKINGTDLVYLNSEGEVLYAPPIIEESIIAPDGVEKERRKPEDISSNVVVGGNPAKVIKELDPSKESFTRIDLFKDPESLEELYDHLDKLHLSKNTIFEWIKSVFFRNKSH